MSGEPTDTPLLGVNYLLELKEFLENDSIIFTHFIDDFKSTEWPLDVDRDTIYDSVKNGLCRDQEQLSLNELLIDEEFKLINLLTDILMQKHKGLCMNNSGADIYFGILNLYGFQDEVNSFFKIPVFKIITSDYQNLYFVLLNGLTFDDLGALFGFIENMPSSTICVPLQYSSYFEKPSLFTKNKVSLFKTQNNSQNCFNECTIKINFKNFIEAVKYLYVYNIEEKVSLLMKKLLRTIETDSSETMIDIEHLMKTETFVHTVILWKIIEKLELTWERPLSVWTNIEEETLNQERDEILEELFNTIDQGWIHERFKKYYISDRNSLLVNAGEQETLCISRLNSREKLDLNPFIEGILSKSYKSYKILDVVRREYSIKRIKFDPDKDFEIIFHEVIPNQILGCAILKNSDAFFSAEDTILPSKVNSNNNASSYCEEMEVEIFKDLDGSPLTADEIRNLEEFFRKTTMEQEFIAKTQGHFNPRILLKPDEETMKRFVQVVAFGIEETSNYEGLSQKDKDGMICKITKKIIKEAKQFGKDGLDKNKNVIYYDAIQLFGYQLKKKLFKKEKEEKIYKFPLFKVYKNINDKNPIIIDVDCNKYKDWKTFLERNVLGKGDYLCVPKNGRYINEDTKKIEIEHLINKPIYWTAGRAALVGVNTAILLGSTALAFYTGPIGMGVRALTLTTSARLGIAGVGVCTSSIGLGITLSKKGLFMSEKFHTHTQTITFLLNVASDILVLYGETSVFAAIAAQIVIPTTAALSSYVVCRLIYEAIKMYRETGIIDNADIWKIVNALLLFGNSYVKFGNIGKFIKSNRSIGSKLPVFGGLPALNKVKITGEIFKPNHLARCLEFTQKPVAVKTQETLRNLFKSATDYFTNNTTLQDFKSDLRNFTEELIDEVAEVIEPLISSFLEKRFGITLKTLTGTDQPISNLLKEYIPKICLFIQCMADIGKRVLRKIKSQLGLDESMENPIEDLIGNLSEPLAIEGPLEPKSNIEKIMKAEEFVRTTAYKKEISKLKLYLNDGTKISPELMENVVKETVDEIMQDANHSNFKKKFEEFCSGYEKLILLEEDEKTKLYVFQYITEDDFKTAIREEDQGMENRLRRIEENIFTYVDENKTVLIFSDSDDPCDRLGYMMIWYNEQKDW